MKSVKFVNRLLPEYCKDTCTVHNGNYIEIHYDECLGCGKCYTVCPMKVFDTKDRKPIIKNEADCIHCSLCKNNCPEQAISIHHS